MGVRSPSAAPALPHDPVPSKPSCPQVGIKTCVVQMGLRFGVLGSTERAAEGSSAGITGMFCYR